MLTVPAYLIWSRKWWGVACLLFDAYIYLAAGIVGRYVVYGVVG